MILKPTEPTQKSQIFSDTRMPLDAKHAPSSLLRMKCQLRGVRLLLAYCRQITVNIFQLEAQLSQFKTNIPELLANPDGHI